jgi:ribonuclease-3
MSEPEPLISPLNLGITFFDPSLLELALTHPSFSFETGSKSDNQRLEFLGDAVLQTALTDLIFREFPKRSEGEMTKIRAALVNRSALAQRARKLQLGPHLRMGRGEEMNGGRERESNLADAFEAVIGAIYLDQGFSVTAQWLGQLLREDCLLQATQRDDGNPKGQLQELLQSKGKTAPSYQVLEVSGPDHARHYRVAVCSLDEVLGEGSGSNKKTAEMEAALAALRSFQK